MEPPILIQEAEGWEAECAGCLETALQPRPLVPSPRLPQTRPTLALAAAGSNRGESKRVFFFFFSFLFFLFFFLFSEISGATGMPPLPCAIRSVFSILRCPATRRGHPLKSLKVPPPLPSPGRYHVRDWWLVFPNGT